MTRRQPRQNAPRRNKEKVVPATTSLGQPLEERDVRKEEEPSGVTSTGQDVSTEERILTTVERGRAEMAMYMQQNPSENWFKLNRLLRPKGHRTPFRTHAPMRYKRKLPPPPPSLWKFVEKRDVRKEEKPSGVTPTGLDVNTRKRSRDEIFYSASERAEESDMTQRKQSKPSEDTRSLAEKTGKAPRKRNKEDSADRFAKTGEIPRKQSRQERAESSAANNGTGQKRKSPQQDECEGQPWKKKRTDAASKDYNRIHIVYKGAKGISPSISVLK